MTITTTQQQKALNILRGFWDAFDRNLAYYSKQDGRQSAITWNQKRIEDVEFLASLISSLEATSDDSETKRVCPF